MGDGPGQGRRVIRIDRIEAFGGQGRPPVRVAAGQDRAAAPPQGLQPHGPAQPAAAENQQRGRGGGVRRGHVRDQAERACTGAVGGTDTIDEAFRASARLPFQVETQGTFDRSARSA